MDNLKIILCAQYLVIYSDRRKELDFDLDSFNCICEMLADALWDWTGNTYVGVPKEESTSFAFQQLFLALEYFITQLKSGEIQLNQLEEQLVSSLMYRGHIYRYLGNACDEQTENRERIIPQYNEIYVSWSKSPQNDYIEEKLYDRFTWLHAVIQDDEFGIDIEGYDQFYHAKFSGMLIAKTGEREVVFPTFEENVQEIKFSDEEHI